MANTKSQSIYAYLALFCGVAVAFGFVLADCLVGIDCLSLRLVAFASVSSLGDCRGFRLCPPQSNPFSARPSVGLSTSRRTIGEQQQLRMKVKPKKMHARGAEINPPNRFEEIFIDTNSEIEIAPWETEAEESKTLSQTTYLKDHAETIITYNDSPDVGFDAGINVYRGCEHGCIYCYARPTHEYLGFSCGLDFERNIFVKEHAPELLWKALSKRSWKPQVLAMSGATDPYQPIERRLGLTRRCLEVLCAFRNPVGIITKNQLILRDLDLLKRLNAFSAVVVFISLTTLDSQLRSVMEPRTSPPAARLRSIETLAKNGIPVGVMLAPILPGLTDFEIPKLVKSAAEAGAQFAGHGILRLPYQVKSLFLEWLQKHFPDQKEKILNQIQSIREGKLNASEFGLRKRGVGIFADQIEQWFHIACKKSGIANRSPKLSTASFRRSPEQFELFD